MKMKEELVFLGVISIAIVLSVGIVFLNKKLVPKIVQEKNLPTEEYDKELMSCLENELNSYLTPNEEDLMEIPLSKIINNDEDIAYYKGVYAKENSENKYVILSLKNLNYDYDIMKYFEKYFYNQFNVYQTFESHKTPTIYIHSLNNDVDFKSITNKCLSRTAIEGKNIPNKTLDRISKTNKIVIKYGQEELGIINSEEKTSKIVSAIKESERYGDSCLADGHSFDFELYDQDNNLIDTIFVWRDGARLVPKSIDGCYYMVTNDINIRKIMEEETDFIFYGIHDYRDDDNQKEQLIYQDDNNSYYIRSNNLNDITIGFALTNQIMNLKYALENKYISAEKVAKDYPDILIKKEN